MSCIRDFYQLPPPFGKHFLYTPSNNIGRQLWEEIDSVVILSIAMRQTDDIFANLLLRARVSQLTAEDIFINNVD